MTDENPLGIRDKWKRELQTVFEKTIALFTKLASLGIFLKDLSVSPPANVEIAKNILMDCDKQGGQKRLN